MNTTYDKNECGYYCMVEAVEVGSDFLGYRTQVLKRGVTTQRHPTKAEARKEAVKNMEAVLA